MTYCIGLKAPGAVCLVADSVTTGRDIVWPPSTPFAEAIDVNKDGIVADRYCKIARIQNALFCFSGDVSIGRSIGNCLRDELVRGVQPLSALNVVLNSHCPLSRAVELLFAFFDNTGLHLVEFHSADGKPPRETDFGQIGSAGERWRKLTDVHVSPIRQRFKVFRQLRMDDGRSITAMLVAQLQCYGFYDAVIAEGFGGTFAGAYVDHEGAHWQGEHLYIRVHDDRQLAWYTTVGIHDECLVTWSMLPEGKFERGLKLLPNILGDYSAAPPSLRISQRACSIMHTFSPDYIVCFANPPRRNVALIEMRTYPSTGAAAFGEPVDVPQFGDQAFAVPIRISAIVDKHLRQRNSQEKLNTLLCPLGFSSFAIPARLLWLPCERHPLMSENELAESDRELSYLRKRGMI
jgi:hypothetical protein